MKKRFARLFRRNEKQNTSFVTHNFKLEERVLFDAAAAVDVVAAVDAADQATDQDTDNNKDNKDDDDQELKNASTDGQTVDTQSADAAKAQENPADNADVDAQVEKLMNGDLPDASDVDDATADELLPADTLAVEANANADNDGMVEAQIVDSGETISTDKELVVINSSVQDKEVILASLKPNQEVLILEDGNGLDEVQEYLDEHADTKYGAIHFITHGNEGVISINGEVINAENVNAEEWSAIGEHLTQDGDILFYGCNTAKTAEGQTLIDTIADASGADVSASDDATGATGDWDLEYTVGTVEHSAITVDGYDYDLPGSPIDYIDADGTTKTCYSYKVVTDGDTEWSNGWYVVTGNVDINHTVTVSGNVHLILVDSFTLNVTTTEYETPGINVSGASITVYAQTNGTGALNATGGNEAAGIGWEEYDDVGTITINGGNVTATGSFSGIGGGVHADTGGSSVTINGGTVVANGGDVGKAINAATVTVKAGLGYLYGASASKTTVVSPLENDKDIKTEIAAFKYVKAAIPATVTYKNYVGGAFVDATIGEKGDTGYTLISGDLTEAQTWTEGYYVIGADYNNDGKIDATDATLGTNTFTISNTVTATGDVKLILADGFTLNVTATGDAANAITAETLTIYGQTNGTGTLTATGGDGTVGAGGDGIYANGDITIEGGTVKADGGKATGASGAGGNGIYAGGAVTIRGTNTSVTAKGGTSTPGAGGIGINSEGESSDAISIIGGTVTATGGDGYTYGGEGISTSVGISITGGTVEATGGGCTNGNAGAGIFALDAISITGGTVTATGGTGTTNGDGIYSSSVTVSATLTVKAGTTSASDTIVHTSEQNIATDFSGKRYAAVYKATELTVDDDWASLADGTVVTGGIIGLNAFGTIQKAVNAADISSGAVTVNVNAGTYTEGIALNKSNLQFTEDAITYYGKINLVGASGANLNGYVTSNNQNLSDFSISGFTMLCDSTTPKTNGTCTPLYLENASAVGYMRNINISGNTITGTDYGLYMNASNCTNITFSNNTVNKASSWSIEIGWGDTNAVSDNIVISGNTIQDGSDGIGLYGKIEHSQVTGNTFTDVGYALYVSNANSAIETSIDFSGNAINGSAVVFRLANNTAKKDFSIGSGNTYNSADITGWADTANAKFLVVNNAVSGSKRRALYYDHRVYLGDETAFTTAKAAYNAASDNGTLVMMNNTTPVEVQKSDISVATLIVNAAWSGKQEGEAVTLDSGTFYFGLNAFCNFKDAIAAVKAETTAVKIAAGTYTGDDNYGNQVFINTGTGTLMLGTVGGAVVSSDPGNATGTYLQVGVEPDDADTNPRFFDETTADKYALAAGSDLKVFQFYTQKYGNSLFTMNGIMTTEGSTLIKAGTRMDIIKGATYTVDGSNRPSANGTIYGSYGTTNVYGDLVLTLNNVSGGNRIRIGWSSYQNKDAQMNVNGGTVTVRSVAGAHPMEPFAADDPAVTEIAACAQKLTGDTAAMLSVSNGGLYDTAGQIINKGIVSITINKADARQSQIKMTSFDGASGTINIDMVNADTTQEYILIDDTNGGENTYGTQINITQNWATKIENGDLIAYYNPHDPTGAAGLVVTTTDDVVADDGFISLREAIANAAADAALGTHDPTMLVDGKYTITFDANVFTAETHTITLNYTGSGTTSLGLSIEANTFGAGKNLVIQGIASNDFSVTLNGNDAVRILNVAADNTVTLNDLTFTGARADDGGAINNLGTLTVDKGIFSQNHAGKGGAVFNQGTATFTDSTFTGNSADGNGGAIKNSGTLVLSNDTFTGNTAKEDGAISNSGTATITNSTFTGNSATDIGGAICNTGTLDISGSSFTDNTTADNGGAINNFGTATITSSTFTGNKTVNYGGSAIYADTCDGKYTYALTINGCSFSDNTAAGSLGGTILANEAEVKFSGENTFGMGETIVATGDKSVVNVLAGAKLTMTTKIEAAQSTVIRGALNNEGGIVIVPVGGATNGVYYSLITNNGQQTVADYGDVSVVGYTAQALALNPAKDLCLYVNTVVKPNADQTHDNNQEQREQEVTQKMVSKTVENTKTIEAEKVEVKISSAAMSATSAKAEAFTIDSIVQDVSKTIAGDMTNVDGFARGSEISLDATSIGILYEFPLNKVEVPEEIFHLAAEPVEDADVQIMDLPEVLEKSNNFKNNFEKLLEEVKLYA